MSYRYVYLIDENKGNFRPLGEAQIWNADRSAESPEKAAALLRFIQTRFPGMIA